MLGQFAALPRHIPDANLPRISLNISYPLEILSFKIRANGLFLQGLTTNICLALSQYTIPLGIAAGGWRFYFFFEGWLVIQFVVVYFYFIETRGATLEEISKTFDGVDAVEEFKAKANDAIGVSDIAEVGDKRKNRGGMGGDGEVSHVDEIHETKWE